MAALPAPTSQLAQDLAPLQATLSFWLWIGVGVAGVAAVVCAWRTYRGAAVLFTALGCFALAVLCDIDRDQRVGWEQDRFARLSALRADELYYYLPDASRVKLAAFGHNNLAADGMYFRSLFFIHQTADSRGSGDLIYRMYTVIQQLNPSWKEPQLTGPVLVSALGGEDRQMRDNRIAEATEMLQASQHRFPDDFRFLDLETNLYWGAAGDAAQEQAHSRRMVELYGRILETFPARYRAQPACNPYLEYVRRATRDRIAALADDWYRANLPAYDPDPRQPAPTLTAEQQTAAIAYWQGVRESGDPQVRGALEGADQLFTAYADSRRDLRDRLLMSLNAPDFRAERMQRALAFTTVLVHELQSEVLDQRERPGKVLDYLRWTDVLRQTGYEVLIATFRERVHRLPTRAEFEQLAWLMQHEPGDPEKVPPPPKVAPGPLDPCGWAYVYEIDDSGTQFRVRSHFANVYKAAVKANRLLTVIDQTTADLGRRPNDLGEVRAYLERKYPAGAVLPPTILDSFGAEKDVVSAPCGGQFEWVNGKLLAPADIQTWLTLKKDLEKLPFTQLYARTRPYAPPQLVAGSAVPEAADGVTGRAVETGRQVVYP